jgi:hypothetical protein
MHTCQLPQHLLYMQLQDMCTSNTECPQTSVM